MSLSKNPRVRLAELRERWDADRRSRVFLQLAEEYRRQGQASDAIGVLEVGLSHNPSSVAGQVALGRCLLELGRKEEARDVLEAVLSKDPTQMVAYRHLIDLHLGLDEGDEARERMAVYEQLNPLDPELEDLRKRVQAAPSNRSEPEQPSSASSESPKSSAATDPEDAESRAQSVASDDSIPTDDTELEAPESAGAEAERRDHEDERELGEDEASERAQDAEPTTEPTTEASREPDGEAATVADDGAETGQSREKDDPPPQPQIAALDFVSRWGEIFPLSTALVESDLHFGPLRPRGLRRVPLDEPVPSSRAAGPISSDRSLLEQVDEVRSAEAESEVVPRENTLELPGPAEGLPPRPDTRLEDPRTGPTAGTSVGLREVGAGESDAAARGAVADPSDRGAETLTAERLLAMYPQTASGLQLTPTLERRRRLVSNYLRALISLREED